MNRKIVFAEGEYYHIYNRGVEKRDVFLTDSDKARFQALLYLCNGSNPILFKRIDQDLLFSMKMGNKSVGIGAYVLMSNHFHLLVKEITSGGVSMFMQKLTTAYSMYFNKKYERVGPLFQGAFKAEHCEGDEYLKYLYAYIHLNPVKLIEPKWKETGLKNITGAQEYLNTGKYSSYLDYKGKTRSEVSIIDPILFPEYFSEPNSMEDYLNEWLSFQEKFVQGETSDK